MTPDQLTGYLRQVLPNVGMLLTTMGLMSPEGFASWANIIMTLAGPTFIIGSFIWSHFSNSKASILTSAGNMPEVKKVVLEANMPGTAALAGAATPSNVRLE